MLAGIVISLKLVQEKKASPPSFIVPSGITIFSILAPTNEKVPISSKEVGRSISLIDVVKTLYLSSNNAKAASPILVIPSPTTTFVISLRIVSHGLSKGYPFSSR